ncbi:unnamed protein product [Peronospora destructor]|uniref:Protein kinase domain-containing protein n=1 Tax=Peronospora destructor TaxID=86335 RepID=A0AAV0TZ02_9STRA|nr:unnamed protein product [Peronospora destructor]
MVLLGGTLNVVHFFGAYEDDDNVSFVMERCVGCDVSTRLSEVKEMDLIAGVTHEERAKTRSPLKLIGATSLDEGKFLNNVHGTPLFTAPEVLKHKYAFPSAMG